MGINLKFYSEDWERIGRDWAAWWAGEIDRPMVMIETYDLMLSAGPEAYSEEFFLGRPVAELLDHYQAKLEGNRYRGDAWPKFVPYFGPGLVAAFLGSRVRPMPNERTVWFEAAERVGIEDLHFEYDPGNVWWKRVQDITRGAVERWGDRVSVGHTDLGGVLDILASFRTMQNLLCDLIESPEEVMRLSGEITRLWLRYYDELHAIIQGAGRGTANWGAIWSPGRTYMHQCDFAYGISPRMFENFVAPDLDACFKRMDHAFYHLDGKGQIPHVDILLAMENLRGIQWIAGAGQPLTEEWMPLLKRIRDGGKLCQVYVTQGGARKIARELGGKGFAFYVILWPPMSDTEVEDFLKEMATEY